MSRLRALVGTLALLAALGAVPVVGAAPAAARPFGSGPFADVVNAANAVAASQNTCGASANQLAAMSIAMVFHETGALGSVPPSPMTLSRWDTSASLFSFGDSSASNPYRRAFFHPGVGMWQYDSAGLGRSRAAGSFMDTATAAPAQVATIRTLWCAAVGNAANTTPEMRRAQTWRPWHACNKVGAVCEGIYNEIFDGTNLNLSPITSMSSTGGMQPRRCYNSVTGAAVDCFYVNPALAEGYVGWTSEPNGIIRNGAVVKAPLSLPFYVYEYNGTEFRHWITSDTGFPSEIRATRPLTANARGGLTWTSGPSMCDLTADRGSCPQLPALGPTVTPLSTHPSMAGPGRGPGLTAWTGRVAIAERRSDGSVLISSLAAPLWSGHTYLGGQTLTDPDTATLGGDHLAIFVLGTDRSVYMGAWQNGGFTGWAGLGGQFSSGPTAVGSGPGRMDVFARGLDGAIWTGTWSNGAFTGWASLGGGFLSEPTVASWATGRLDVFATGQDRALWHRAFNGTTWGPWESLGGVLASAPGAASGAVNQIDVAARVADGSVYMMRWTGASWIGWTPLGGSLASAPDVAATANGAMVIARAANGVLYRAERIGSGFTSWSPVP